ALLGGVRLQEKEIVGRRVEGAEDGERILRQGLLPLARVRLGQHGRQQDQIGVHLVEIGDELLLVKQRAAAGLQLPLHGPQRLVVITVEDIILDVQNVLENGGIARQIVIESHAQQAVAEFLGI